MLAVRFMAVELAKPKNGKLAQAPDCIRLNLVDLREIDPPEGADAVHWRLLTTHPVGDAVEALAVADLYRRRWAIEQLFRTMKTQGFDIEGLRIEDEQPRCNLVMAALTAAVIVQQLVHARDGKPGLHGQLRPITDAFEPEDAPLLAAYCAKLEGKTARQKNPHPAVVFGLRVLGLRSPRRLDRLLRRKPGPHRDAQRMAAIPSWKSRHRCYAEETRCVNPIA